MKKRSPIALTAVTPAARSMMIEPLETRQFLSAVVDVRLPGGGKNIIDPTVGQVINLQVWVTITGKDSNVTNEGLQIAAGSLLSSNSGGGLVTGTMAFTLASPFTGTASQSGTHQDLDSDGDIDVGSNDSSTSDNYIFARADSPDTSGTAVTKGQAFEIGTATFTVTKLLTGTSTNLLFRPRGLQDTLLDQEDGVANGSPGVVLTQGTGVLLTHTPTSTIDGRVFNDKNADGLFDGVDTGISGFRVFLDTNGNGDLDEGEISKPVSTTGTYHFTSVPPGTYRVREVFRDGWRQSFPALGYYQVTLGYGDAAKSQSFANTDTVLMKGEVWMDADKDKKLDAGEGGLPGWTLFLDQNDNGVIDTGEQTTTTDANGNYRFFNLPAGKYEVRIVQRSGYRLTTPASGTHVNTLAAAGTKSNQNFGEKRLK